jgi:polysaccharide export outer membrane protein
MIAGRSRLAVALALATASLARGQGSSLERELAYRVGPGDVLEVTVESRPELSRLPTVQTTGTIFFPLLGEVPVADLPVADVEVRLSSLLAKEGVKSPARVRVREFNSRSVFVGGEVTRPGRKALKAGGRLIDTLVDAGGFSAAASGEVLVSRRDGAFDDGTTTRLYRFKPGEPSDEARQNLALLLQPGDVITARARQYFLVSGEVERPGRYLLDDGMTVTKALEAAGGLTRFGNPKVNLERALPAEGEPGKVEIDTRAVLSGESPDPALRPDDSLSVRARKI